MDNSAKYYLIERVIEKALMDNNCLQLQKRMSGYGRTPEIVLLAKRAKKTLYPLHYYTHTDDLLSSPLRQRLTAYGYTPYTSLDTLSKMRDIGVTRLVLHSQYFRDVPSPRSLQYDPNEWHARYSVFRQYAQQCGIELYINRLKYRAHFLARIHDGATDNSSMMLLLMGLKKIKIDGMIEQDANFPKTKWAVTHPDFLTDHVRAESIRLMSPKDAMHLRGYIESDLGPLLVVRTAVMSSQRGAKNWDIVRERAPLVNEPPKGDNYVLRE